MPFGRLGTRYQTADYCINWGEYRGKILVDQALPSIFISAFANKLTKIRC